MSAFPKSRIKGPKNKKKRSTREDDREQMFYHRTVNGSTIGAESPSPLKNSPSWILKDHLVRGMGADHTTDLPESTARKLSELSVGTPSGTASSSILKTSPNLY